MRNVATLPVGVLARQTDTTALDRAEEFAPNDPVEPQGEAGDFIDSSEAAAVLGLDPGRTPLDIWHRHMGRLTQLPIVRPVETRISWEFVLEPLISAVYSKRTGHAVRRVQKLVRDVDQPWMGACVRWQVASMEVQLLQCMEVTPADMHLWESGVPEHVRVGMMHSLAVTGQQALDIAALLAGRRVKIFRVERDEALIERLRVAEAEFWGFVERGRPPPAR